MTSTAKLVITSLLISLMSGCATSSKESLLPQDGPTMKDVYRQHEYNMSHEVPKAGTDTTNLATRHIGNADVDLEGYTRDSNNEIQSIFPRLPNPTLVMYVYPHLSTVSRLPVPGYSTSFPMYDRPEYALPGER